MGFVQNNGPEFVRRTVAITGQGELKVTI